MSNQNIGDTFWIEATITDKNGAHVAPDSQTVTLKGSRCNVTSTTINRVGAGKYEAELTIPTTAASGLYTIIWVVQVNGKQETEKYYFTVH